MTTITLSVEDAIVASWVAQGLDPVPYLQDYMAERAKQFDLELIDYKRRTVAAAYLAADTATKAQIDAILRVPPRTRG